MPGSPRKLVRRAKAGDPVAIAQVTISERRRQGAFGRLPDYASVPAPDPTALLTEILKDDRAMYYLALTERDALGEKDYWVPYWDAQGNKLVRAHPWVEEARKRGADLADLLLSMQKNGIADRMAMVEEAKIAMVMLTMERVLDRLGLTAGQRAQLGPILREEAEALREAPVIEGAAA